MNTASPMVERKAGLVEAAAASVITNNNRLDELCSRLNTCISALGLERSVALKEPKAQEPQCASSTALGKLGDAIRDTTDILDALLVSVTELERL